MKPSAPTGARSAQALASAGALASAAALVLCASAVHAQTQSAWPASITSISQTFTTVAGVPTLLTIGGSGNCRYHLSYVKQGAPAAPLAPLTFSSTPQSPFPMQLKILDATPAGIYTWTVRGIDGCTGSQNLTFTVR